VGEIVQAACFNILVVIVAEMKEKGEREKKTEESKKLICTPDKHNA